MAQTVITKLWLLTAACAAYFIAPATVEAGFICADVKLIGSPSQHPPDAESSSRPTQKAPLPWADADSRANAAQQPGKGMSAPNTLTSPSGGSAFANLPAEQLPIATTLIAYLGPEGQVWLPPPFSTGVFRPPRFVG